MIRCLVIDDEPIARAGLIEHLEQIAYVSFIGQCRNAIEGQKALQDQELNLIFLDIQMPLMSGIELVKMLKNPPLIVFTTAHTDYAMQGYELNILDYLLKPISFPRLLQSVLKAKDYLEAHAQQVASEPDYFFTKCNGNLEKIVIAQVVYVQAMGNYSIIHRLEGRCIAYLSLKSLQDLLPFPQFVQIHKSYLVNLACIKMVEKSAVQLEEATIPLGKRFRSQLLDSLSAYTISR